MQAQRLQPRNVDGVARIVENEIVRICERDSIDKNVPVTGLIARGLPADCIGCRKRCAGNVRIVNGLTGDMPDKYRQRDYKNQDEHFGFVLHDSTQQNKIIGINILI